MQEDLFNYTRTFSVLFVIYILYFYLLKSCRNAFLCMSTNVTDMHLWWLNQNCYQYTLQTTDVYTTCGSQYIRRHRVDAAQRLGLSHVTQMDIQLSVIYPIRMLQQFSCAKGSRDTELNSFITWVIFSAYIQVTWIYSLYTNLSYLNKMSTVKSYYQNYYRYWEQSIVVYIVRFQHRSIPHIMCILIILIILALLSRPITYADCNLAVVRTLAKRASNRWYVQYKSGACFSPSSLSATRHAA